MSSNRGVKLSCYNRVQHLDGNSAATSRIAMISQSLQVPRAYTRSRRTTCRRECTIYSNLARYINTWVPRLCGFPPSSLNEITRKFGAVYYFAFYSACEPLKGIKSHFSQDSALSNFHLKAWALMKLPLGRKCCTVSSTNATAAYLHASYCILHLSYQRHQPTRRVVICNS